jgi:hypothetical protein
MQLTHVRYGKDFDRHRVFVELICMDKINLFIKGIQSVIKGIQSVIKGLESVTF